MDECPSSDNPISIARVACAGRGAYLLWTDSGEERLANLTGTFAETPVVGDWVRYEAATNRIRELIPRKNRLARKKVGRATEEQVMAANVDVLLLVMALDHDFNIRRMERYLILAAETGAAPVIVLNKSDQCADLKARLKEIEGITKAPVAVMSAIESETVAQLSKYVEPGQTAVLLGSSGVGKSTITNALLGAARQAVSAVRDHDHRGQHTTTTRELFRMPGGWILIDTPGMRELEPWSSTEAVADVFSDIEKLAARCRYRDCQHLEEPACEITKAVKRGRLDPARLASFRKLTTQLDEQARKRIGKIGQKSMRNLQKLRDTTQDD